MYLKSKFKSQLSDLFFRIKYGPASFLKVGYPKSGNNWVHFLLANAIAKSAGAEPDIHFRNKADWISTTKPKKPPVDGFPRLLSNTDPYDEQRYITKNTKVLYIIRHPADVLESHYHYLKHRWNKQLGGFSSFVKSKEYGVTSWKKHVKSWISRWDVLVQFEDLKEKPLSCLEKICSLFSYNFDTSTLRYAVEKSSFENMAVMEEKYGLPQKEGANMNYTFMRKGATDQGKEYFDEQDYRYLLRHTSGLLCRFGYDVPIRV